ncbi:hypothetical protein ZWY2020_057651 [Hordeum vulgare]|nr:hypothetical protein ZWY2020_057651 [Hordeum vulgare]
MTVAQYCRRLQQLAVAMSDVGEPVSDRSLTLQLIRGLSRRFHVMATLLPMQHPFPAFLQARSRLLLEEIAVIERERATGATALSIGHAGPSSGGGPSFGGGDRTPPPAPADKGKTPVSNNSFGDRQRGGRGRGRGRGHPGASSSGGAGRVGPPQQ